MGLLFFYPTALEKINKTDKTDQNNNNSYNTTLKLKRKSKNVGNITYIMGSYPRNG